MQRHHAALAEADQRELRIVEAKPLEFRIEKRVNRASRLDCAVPALPAATHYRQAIGWKARTIAGPLALPARARARAATRTQPRA